MSPLLLAIALLSALSIMSVVLMLIKKRALGDEYASIWVLVSLSIFGSTVLAPQLLWLYAWLKGEQGAGQEILLFGALVFVVYFLILVSVKLTQKNRQITKLSQELGLLRHDVAECREILAKDKSPHA